MNRAAFEELISHVVKTPSQTASRLEEHFGSYSAVFEAEPVEIANALDADMNVAIYIKLAISLVSRRYSDKLTSGKKYTDEEIESEEDGALNMYYHGCLKSRPKNCPLKEVGNEA